MPEDLPQFSSQPLGEGKAKKRVVRRRAVSRTRRSSTTKVNKEMDSQLSSIYRDDHGHLPDMGKIKIQKKHSTLKTFFGIIVLGGLLAAAAWAGFFLLPTANKTSDNQIKLNIDGPQNVSLGSNNTYKISFENLQNVKLKNASLTIYYPEGFSFTDSSVPSKNSGHTEWDLGVIGARKKGELVISGKSYGALNKEASWRILLNYQPENFNSILQKIITFTTSINQSPVNISISGPNKAAAGTEVEYTFKVKTDTDFNATSMELSPIWPPTFHLTSTTPAIKKTTWVISGTTPEMVFKARGQFSDAEDKPSEIKATLYLTQQNPDQKFEIATSNLNTEIVKNALSLNLAINGSLNNFSSKPGEMLNINLKTKNSSAMILNKATVKLTLDAPSLEKQSMLNWAEMKDDHDGTVKGEQINNDVRRGVITWDSKKIASLSELKPGDEVSIDVSMPIKTLTDFDLSAAKEFKINATAEISFMDINGKTQIVASNPIVITINSDLAFETRDTISTTADGKELHEITWKLTNNAHPLKNISVSADFYGDTTWNEPTGIPAGEVKFDPKTKTATWTVAQMPASLDLLALPLNITLNKKNPTQNTLMSKVKISAEDIVTGETIKLIGDEILLNTKSAP